MEHVVLENKDTAEPSQEIQGELAAQISLESNANFNWVITEISNAFTAAVAETDPEKIKGYLKTIRMHEDYLGEKYRHTREERSYLKKVNEAIDYLSSK